MLGMLVGVESGSVVASRWLGRVVRRLVPGPRARTRPRATVVTGTVWRGADDVPAPGRVTIGVDGRLATVVLDRPGTPPPPPDARLVEATWIGPALLDAHVRLRSGADLDRWHAAGLAGVRDAGGVLAFPTTGVGADTVVVPVTALTDTALAARLSRLAAAGVRAVTVDLTTGPDTAARVTRAAHEAGLAVLAEAVTADLVGRALDTGVDELLRVPGERLSDALVERLATAGLRVTSTLQAYFSAGRGRDAAATAATLVRAGVPLRYGTRLGQGGGGGAPGIDARELDRLADAGLGRLGALRAATDGAADVFPGRRGRLVVGEPADLVALTADPLVEPLAWRTPRLVVVGGRVLAGRSG
ncbi:hypothetical protein ACXR2U_12805 [Jatrophihabitans sp. YIM 134969]